MGLLGLLLALAAVRTVSYAWRWNDALRLYTLCRRDFPRSVYLHILEAEQRIDRGELEEAEQILAQARGLTVESQNVWALSAQLAERLGKQNEAQIYRQRAFDLNLHPPHMDDSQRLKP
jgi:predicted Zn-dependent protease